MSGTSMIGLIEKIITSTPNMLRTVAAIVLLLGAVIGGLWLLDANLTAGPVRIVGREPVEAKPALCAPIDPARGVSRACGR